jgi:hypothetical protein
MQGHASPPRKGEKEALMFPTFPAAILTGVSVANAYPFGTCWKGFILGMAHAT